MLYSLGVTTKFNLIGHGVRHEGIYITVTCLPNNETKTQWGSGQHLECCHYRPLSSGQGARIVLASSRRPVVLGATTPRLSVRLFGVGPDLSAPNLRSSNFTLVGNRLLLTTSELAGVGGAAEEVWR